MKKLDLKTKIAVKIGTAFLRSIGHTDDAAMMKHITRLIKILRFVKQNKLAYYVEDILGIYKRGPVYTKILREMLTQSDDAEFEDLFYGIVNLPENVRLKADFQKSKIKIPEKPVDVLVAVENSFYFHSYFKCLDALREFNLNLNMLYSPEDLQSLPRSINLQTNFTSSKDLFFGNKNIDTLIIIGNASFNNELLLHALNRARTILVCGAAAENEKENAALKEKLSHSLTRVIFYTPSQNFYPYLKAKQLIEDRVLGAVTEIKVKTVVGKCHLKNTAVELPQILANDLYDKIPFVNDILGEPQQNFHYENKQNGSFSVYTQITKHKTPRTYSVYEFVHAPELRDNKHTVLFFEKIEITGSMGTLWLNWQKTKFVNDPIMTLYVGDKEIKMGAVPDDFPSSFSRALCLL